MNERRQSSRISHRAPIRFFLDGDLDADFLLESGDIGQTGAFVASDLLPSPGERLAFELDWAGQNVVGWARVVRVAAAPTPGFAMVFEQISPA